MRDTDYEILEEIKRFLPQDKTQEFNEAWEKLKGEVEEQAYWRVIVMPYRYWKRA